MQIYHRLTLDCQKQGTQAVIPISRGEANSHILHVTFCLSSSPVTLTGSEYASLYALLPDGEQALVPCTLYGENSPYPSTVSLVIPSSLSAQQGSVKCRIALGDSLHLYCSPEFALRVEENGISALELSEQSDYSALVSLAASARENALAAEGWAVGRQNSVDVGASSPYYKASAKYYAEQAQNASLTLDSEVSASSENPVQSRAVKSYVDSAINQAVSAQLQGSL